MDTGVPDDKLLLVQSMQTGEMPKPVGLMRPIDVKAMLENSTRDQLTWIIVTDEAGIPVGGTHGLERWTEAIVVRLAAQYN